MIDIKAVLAAVKENGAPDLHIKVGKPPVVRLPNGEVYISPDIPVLTLEDVNDIINTVTPSEKLEIFNKEFEADFSFSDSELGRFRINLYQEKDGPALAFRMIPYEIPDSVKFGVPDVVMNLSTLPRGLILVTGPTGSGKSTTLTMLIDKINRERNSHIITIEDPIEFVYTSKKSIVTQRELGIHTKSFPNAIRASLRQDPDVVMIGEMRDLETMMAAMTLAETGHLVLSTLHTQDAPQTINRIIDSFPQFQQQQIMAQLSLTLKAVVSQTLLPRQDSKGRVCAYEILLNNDGISNLIKEGKTHQLYSMMQLGKGEGMRLLDYDLIRLVQDGTVALNVALSKARDVDFIKSQLGI